MGKNPPIKRIKNRDELEEYLNFLRFANLFDEELSQSNHQQIKDVVKILKNKYKNQISFSKMYKKNRQFGCYIEIDKGGNKIQIFYLRLLAWSDFFQKYIPITNLNFLPVPLEMFMDIQALPINWSKKGIEFSKFKTPSPIRNLRDSDTDNLSTLSSLGISVNDIARATTSLILRRLQNDSLQSSRNNIQLNTIEPPQFERNLVFDTDEDEEDEEDNI